MEPMALCKIKNGSTHQVCWLDKPHRFSRGAIISLKDDPRKWEVVNKTSQTVDKNSIKSDWNAGGVDDKTYLKR